MNRKRPKKKCSSKCEMEKVANKMSSATIRDEEDISIPCLPSTSTPPKKIIKDKTLLVRNPAKQIFIHETDGMFAHIITTVEKPKNVKKTSNFQPLQETTVEIIRKEKKILFNELPKPTIPPPDETDFECGPQVQCLEEDDDGNSDVIKAVKFTDLPTEIIVKILGYISPDDLCKMRSMSVRLNQICASKTLIQDIFYRVEGNLIQNMEDQLFVFKNSNVAYVNLHFHSIESEHMEFILREHKNPLIVKNIILESCYFSCRLFQQIFDTFENIDELFIINCLVLDHLLVTGKTMLRYPKVKHIFFDYSILHFMDSLFSEINGVNTRLEKITIKNCEKANSYISERFLTFLKNHSGSLKIVDWFSNIWWTMRDHDFFNLENMFFYKYLDDENVFKSKRIEILDFSLYRGACFPQYLNLAGQHYKDCLKELHVSFQNLRVRDITEQLSRFEKLEELYISNCCSVLGGWTFGLNKPNLNMKRLTACHITHMNTEEFVSVIEKVPNLEVLDLSFTNEIDDSVIHAVSKNLKRLKTLICNNNNSITDEAFFGEYPITNLKNLTHIDLNSNFQLTNVGLGKLMLPQLKIVRLGSNQVITNKGIDNLTKNCPLIHCLDLSSMERITDGVFKVLNSNLQYLKHLNLWYCSKITMAGALAYEQRHKLKTFKILDDLDISKAVDYNKFMAIHNNLEEKRTADEPTKIDIFLAKAKKHKKKGQKNGTIYITIT